MCLCLCVSVDVGLRADGVCDRAGVDDSTAR